MLHSRVDLHRNLRIDRECRAKLREGDQAGEEIIARKVFISGYVRNILAWRDLRRRHIITSQQVCAVCYFQDLECLILMLGLLANGIGPATREGDVFWCVAKLRWHFGHSHCLLPLWPRCLS